MYIVLADANFPSASVAKHGPELVRADGALMGLDLKLAPPTYAYWSCAGLGIPALLKAVTQLLPLDAYVPNPVINAQTDFL